MYRSPQSATAPRSPLPVIVLLGLLPGCVEPPVPVQIDFAARYGDHVISCTRAAGGAILTDLRFFVHAVSLIDESGQEAAIDLTDDGIWQGKQVAMLDLEDGQGSCLNGSKPVNSSVRGMAGQDGPFRGIRFTLGVPADLNHGNPITAGAPLNDTAMHWHWLTGYKFMRAGIANADDNVWMHLGSSRCDGSIGQGIHCDSPNRVEVIIEGFDPARDRIVLDLQRLFASSDLTDGAPSDCSSGPAETSCIGPFHALGLSLGDLALDAGQGVFAGERKP